MVCNGTLPHTHLESTTHTHTHTHTPAHTDTKIPAFSRPFRLLRTAAGGSRPMAAGVVKGPAQNDAFIALCLVFDTSVH